MLKSNIQQKTIENRFEKVWMSTKSNSNEKFYFLLGLNDSKIPYAATHKCIILLNECGHLYNKKTVHVFN